LCFGFFFGMYHLARCLHLLIAVEEESDNGVLNMVHVLSMSTALMLVRGGPPPPPQKQKNNFGDYKNWW
jgi:hypothetical protein